jgi:hypothetical protein
MVLLGRRAQRAIAQINATAGKLRRELLAGIPANDLETCMKVLGRIRERAEKGDRRRVVARQSLARVLHPHNGQTKRGHSMPARARQSAIGIAGRTTARPNVDIRCQSKMRLAIPPEVSNETSH